MEKSGSRTKIVLIGLGIVALAAVAIVLVLALAGPPIGNIYMNIICLGGTSSPDNDASCTQVAELNSQALTYTAGHSASNNSVPFTGNFPYEGMFLNEGGNLEELVEGKGGPPSQGVPTTTSAQPTIYAWVPDLTTGLLILASQSGKGGYDYTIRPMDNNNNVLELVPRSPLPNDTYCFIQGDASLPGALISHWCFTVAA